MTNLNEKPKPPLARIIGEMDVEFCQYCGSGIVRRFVIARQLGCRQSECSNFFKRVENRR